LVVAEVLLALDPDGSFWAFDADSNRRMGFLLALVCVAMFVLWFGRKQFSRYRSTSAIRPHGRVLREFRRMRPAQWREVVARLEKKPPTPIAELKAGAVRIEGVLRSASGNLGGKPGRECVWRNREGARPESAVAAELVFVADDSGKCAVEGLESALVIAPSEKLTVHHESVSLYLGDRVEIYGTFSADKVEDESDPTQTVYGTLSAAPGLDVRLVQRPKPESTPGSTSADAPT
jgi:hypothetical protein